MDYGTLRCAKLFFCGGEVKRRRKRSKIFGEGKYVFLWRRKTEKEKENGILRGEIYFLRRRR